MPVAGNKQGQALNKKRRRRDESARKFVISLRISDQEKKVLEAAAESGSKNVSEVVRAALELWLQKRRPTLFEERKSNNAASITQRCTTRGVTL